MIEISSDEKELIRKLKSELNDAKEMIVKMQVLLDDNAIRAYHRKNQESWWNPIVTFLNGCH